jgi:hypothetical protein
MNPNFYFHKSLDIEAIELGGEIVMNYRTVMNDNGCISFSASVSPPRACSQGGPPRAC